MIRIAIIEDEAIAMRNIQRMLMEIPIDIEVVAKIESVADAINSLPDLNADLILMDIHLTDGNAFQIFKKIELTIPIIFTTAYDQYTLKAFKQNSIDYLLKPIDKGELEEAIQKFKNLFLSNKNIGTNQYQSLIEILTNEKKFKKRFLIQLGKKLKSIETKDIAYFFVEDKSCYLQTIENKTYIVDFSLSQLENELDPDSFFRINRQYLISDKAIENIYYLSTLRLKVNLNVPHKEDIFVTIDKIGKLKRWLNR